MWKIIPVFLLLALCCAGCFTRPVENYRNLADFKENFPKLDIAELSKKKVLTLRDAQKTAIANNPDYIAAYHAVYAAKFRYYRSLSAYLPTVDLNMSVGQSLENSRDLRNPPEGVVPRENHFSTDIGLRASYLIFDGLAREFAALIAQKEYKKSVAEDENIKRLLIRGVAYAYYDAILAREAERIGEADLAFQTSSLLQAETRYKYGNVSKASVLNFKILANAARSSILNARYRGEVARFALTALMGYPTLDFPKELELTPLEIKPEELMLDLDTYLDMAIANRPDLRAARFMLEIARCRTFSAYSGFLPVINAYLGLDFNTSASKYGAYRVHHSYYNNAGFSYGVTGEWNLFSGFSTYNLLRESRAMEQMTRFNLDSAFLSVMNEVKDAYANYKNAREQVAIYREMMKWVFEQRQLVQVEYWGGRETITRLNGAQSDLVNAEGKLAIAAVELNKAIAQLNAAVNVSFEDELEHQYPQPGSGTPLDSLLNSLDRRFNAPVEPVPLKNPAVKGLD